ncbi:MAG: SAM-dependent methyltransferase [Alphaproteobacteria bacterium]
MNRLARLIARRIASSGPISISEYMALALGHPELGYYTTRDPFGRAGDFITAPEISQVFGEMIGLWWVAVWREMGAPDRFRLVELGPGRGTLMADALRAATVAPDFVRAAQVHLVETSPVLREAQRTTLTGRHIHWHDRFDEVPDGPVLLVANEFFDALPVRQLQRTSAGWRERLVGNGTDGLVFVLSAPGVPAEVLLHPDVRNGAPEGAIAEIQPAALSTAAAIAARISAAGGAALIVDYGYVDSAPGDTLQAVRAHRPHDVLADPGAADLTVHVDFAALGRAAGDSVRHFGPCGQGVFLQALGVELRAEQLMAKATPEQQSAIRSGLTRLIDPAEMGILFKVLALTQQGMPVPPGFEG